MAPPPLQETVQQFFQRMTIAQTVTPMVRVFTAAENTKLIKSIESIPPENRETALVEIEEVITESGGTVVEDQFDYLWSTSTAAPPRVNSIEVDQATANFANISKIWFDNLDKDGIDQMDKLMVIPVNSLILIENATTPSNYLQVLTTSNPIQRQGADGHVEIPCKFSKSGGTLADTISLYVSIS